MKCKKCGSEALMKNGKRNGKQCYLCKDCRHQFISEFGRYSKTVKKMAVSLHVHYLLSYRKIAFMFSVRDTTVLRWYQQYVIECLENPLKEDALFSSSDTWSFLSTRSWPQQ